MASKTIRVKAPISGWHEVDKESAIRFAVSRYEHMMCRNKVERINAMVDGIAFTEEELKNECNRIRRES